MWKAKTPKYPVNKATKYKKKICQYFFLY